MSTSDDLKVGAVSIEKTPVYDMHAVSIFQAKGNAAFSAGNFQEAIDHFTSAIALGPSNHVLYSNRSASYASLGKYEDALQDAEKVTELKPDWSKGWSRRGAALYGLGRLSEAIESYEKGLDLDPSNAQIQQALTDLRSRSRPSFRLFDDPQVLARLAMDPKTRAFMSQPDFMSMLQDINNNIENMSKYQSDERLKVAFEVALGMSMPPPQSEPTPPASSSAAPPAQPETKKEQPPEKEEEEEKDPAKAEAYKEKEAGNLSYKKRDFETAIAHYNKALELYDGDISFITNRAAVKFESGDFDGCIADCDSAVEKGREIRADYKLIARAMTRKGNALVKKGDLEGAIEVFNRSLTEHRNADTLKRLQEVEKALKERKEDDYIDMDKCAEAKEQGNAAFKEGRYPDAVVHYAEALKRGPPKVNPEAHKLYSNRAACYTKLGAWNEGIKDSEECIRLAPDFAKGYSRKGHLQYFMKEYTKAMETYQQGLERDPENSELKEGLARCVQAINRLNRGDASEEELKQRQERALADPEIQRLLTDPIVTQVLRDMQENPAAAQKHLAHPDMAKKIEKLIAAGIVQIR